jgi:hypothetical protein
MGTELGAPRSGGPAYAEAIAAIENARSALRRRDPKGARRYLRLAQRRCEEIED